jgi:drug/metabolite transporter (DMT)-like permease
MNWILLGLAAPLFWAFSNIFDKFALNRLTRGIADFIFFGTIGSFLTFLIFTSVLGFKNIGVTLTVMAMLGGFLLNWSYVFYAKALDKGETSRIVPLFQSIPIFVLVIGALFFNEVIGGDQIFGFIIVLIGGIILTVEKATFKLFKVDAGFWLMLLTSFIIAVSFLLSDHVLEHTHFLTLMTYDLLGFSLAGVSLLLYGPWRREIIEGIKKAKLKKYSFFFINDAVDLSGHFLLKLALIAAPSTALVSVLSGIQPFYVLILTIISTLFFPKLIKEDISKYVLMQKTIGVVVVFIGVIFINY